MRVNGENVTKLRWPWGLLKDPRVPGSFVGPLVCHACGVVFHAAASARVRVGAADCGRLLELLGKVPDPRHRRGIRHRLAGVLAVAAAAVLAGCRSVLAVAEWAAEAPQPVLRELGARRDPRGGCWQAPSEDTFRRLLARVDAAAVDQVIGVFLAERAGCGNADGHQEGGGPGAVMAVAVDGKTLRGAVQAGGRAAYLLAAMTHGSAVVLAQREVGHKTNEITQVKPLLDPLDLRGAVVTLDALHAQRETARYLAEDKGADYIFTAVKDNQPGLFTALDALPWDSVPVQLTMTGRAHGRDETRTIQVLPAPAGIWPHAAQAFLIERYVRDLDGAPKSAIAALGITSLTASRADPARIAVHVRGHWNIENKLHWVRDMDWDEDRSQLRKGSAPQVLATLRNLAVGALHTAGRAGIASGLRWVARDPARVLVILGQPP